MEIARRPSSDGIRCVWPEFTQLWIVSSWPELLWSDRSLKKDRLSFLEDRYVPQMRLHTDMIRWIFAATRLELHSKISGSSPIACRSKFRSSPCPAGFTWSRQDLTYWKMAGAEAIEASTLFRCRYYEICYEASEPIHQSTTR
jgi:hypothetical protein